MMHGAFPESLHATLVAMMSDAQHSLPMSEQPTPPHWPHSIGQHAPADSYPARPLEHSWAVRCVFDVKESVHTDRHKQNDEQERRRLG